MIVRRYCTGISKHIPCICHHWTPETGCWLVKIQVLYFTLLVRPSRNGISALPSKQMIKVKSKRSIKIRFILTKNFKTYHIPDLITETGCWFFKFPVLYFCYFSKDKQKRHLSTAFEANDESWKKESIKIMLTLIKNFKTYHLHVRSSNDRSWLLTLKISRFIFLLF